MRGTARRTRQGRSVIDTGITPTVEDTTITLSTCSEGGRDTRWVVQVVAVK